MRNEIIINEETNWEGRNFNWILESDRSIVKVVEVAKYKAIARPWELTEIRTFDTSGKYMNACLLIKDLDTNKEIEGIEDVWFYQWKPIEE